MERVDPLSPYRLYSVQATRALEQAAMTTLPAHTLMQRAGLAVAQLARAVAPHARCIWVACGPGNNGGDGLEAAFHLRQCGYNPVVTWLGHVDNVPADTQASWQRATQAGVVVSAQPPDQPELCIDALLGIGSARAPEGVMAQWIDRINGSGSPVLAVDLPTGLNADTGACHASCVRAQHTLSLLTLKPGLFTNHGRDAAGQVWWDALGTLPHDAAPQALLPGAPQRTPQARLHASHKGLRGDVAVVGGATGMTGAALLAASAALHAGAGRVFVSLLDPAPLALDPLQPELMLRGFEQLDLPGMALVCGCGGGTAISEFLHALLQDAHRLVLDADALNAIAANPSLQKLLRQRAATHAATVLTPHPLEAARLLGSTTAQVQANRLEAALTLADRFGCTVLLKGSGSISAAPGQTTCINPTGNGLLASAGTGDVLAGLVGARLAGGETAFDAAWKSAFEHGRLADLWPADAPLTAGALARALR